MSCAAVRCSPSRPGRSGVATPGNGSYASTLHGWPSAAFSRAACVETSVVWPEPSSTMRPGLCVRTTPYSVVASSSAYEGFSGE